MASRLNKKFALTLAAISLAAVAVLGGLGLLAYRANTTRYIKAGDQLMAKGDYEAALKDYGRAVAKEESDLSHLRKYEQALLHIRPRTQQQAERYYGLFIGVLRHKIRYRPFDADVHLELLEELHSRARLVNRSPAWDPVYEAAEDMEAGVPQSDPRYVYAKLYKGLAILRRNPVPTDAQVQDALRNLSEFVEAVPDSDSGWAGRVEALLATARLDREAGNKLSSEEKEQKAKEMLQEALKVRKARLGPDADGLGPELGKLRALWWVRRPDDGDPAEMEPPQEITQALDRMVELITESPDPLLLLGATDVLSLADPTEGAAEAIGILTDYLSEHPEHHLHRFSLANLYFYGGTFEAARVQARVIIDAEPVVVSLLAVYHPTLRVRSAALIVNVEYAQWEQAAEDERAAQLQRVKTARDHMATLVTEVETEPLMLRVDAKIALAEGNLLLAADKFERCLRALANPDVETLWYSARVLERIGELGSALMRIDGALGQRPGSVYLLTLKSRLQAGLTRFDDASKTINEALRREPENEEAQRLALLIEEGKTRGAIGPADAVTRAIANAQAVADDDDLDGARSSLLVALQDHGQDEPRLLYALALLEIQAEQLDAAGEYIDRAIQLRPNAAAFRSLKASIGIDDPIERLKLALLARYSSEPERTINTMTGLRRRGRDLRQLAERATASGEDDSAASIQALAVRTDEEADLLLARAQEIAPDHPLLLDSLLGEAIAAADWEAAEAILQRARETSADQAQGLIFRGRYELARSQPEQAVQTLNAATDRKPYSAAPWRMLGGAYEMLGNNVEARRAYEEAYARSPNDRVVVSLYIRLLERTGEKTRALAVLRDSQRLTTSDLQLQDVWLRLEVDVGDSVLAIQKRRELYELYPDQRVNAMRLVNLLGEGKPSFEHILDDEGQSRFDVDRWRQVGAKTKTELLEQIAAEWINESNAILDAVEAQVGDTLELASVRANLLRSRGEVAAGEQILVDYLQRWQEAERTVAMFLSLGRYQVSTNRPRKARATFRRGRAYQDPERREADRALIDLLFANGFFEEGIDLCNELLELGFDRSLSLRIVEGHANLGHLEQAHRRLQELVDADGADFSSTMLLASILGREADELYDNGEAELAGENYARQRQVLAQAEADQPRDPRPHIQTAQSFLHEFQRSGMRSLLDEALLALDVADEVQAAMDTTSIVRVDIYRSMGDERSAIGELNRILERSPDHRGARVLLVTLHESRNELAAAVAAIDEAIERDPLESVWHQAKGSLLWRQGELQLAAQSYGEAYRLRPTKARLTAVSEIVLGMERPNFAVLVGMFGEAESWVELDSKLRSLYARALNGVGQRDSALAQMRIAYREHRAQDDPQLAIASLEAWFRSLVELFGPGARAGTVRARGQ
ncbi:MAG: tetratricopeptide repeat protein [Planctomycetes bacterium]|nr:tetratricopeptide repeat protein [Planctomycetota bacterium]